MLYSILADLVLILHLAFIIFAVLGALLVLKWKGVLWIHLTAAVWAALIEFANWRCPLTPLEIWFRQLAGAEGFEGGFIEHYLLRVIYPPGLTRNVQITMGVLVLLLNIGIYSRVLPRILTRESPSRRS